MTYPLYGNHPQNLLVANQFNPESFQVVQQVYYSLEHLRAIYRYLPMVQSISSNIERFKAIEPYLADIRSIGSSLAKLLTIEDNLPFLKEIAPRIALLAQDLQNLDVKLCTFDTKFNEVLGFMETNTKHLEDLFCQYEAGLQTLIERYKDELCEIHSKYLTEAREVSKNNFLLAQSIKTDLALIKKTADEQKEINRELLHLTASDAVTLYLATGSEEDYQTAYKRIKRAERHGINETSNKTRLTQGKTDMSVLGAVKMNSPVKVGGESK